MPPATTLLLVEDEPPLREVMAQVLAAAGYDVVTAGTGGEALALAGARPDIAVVVTDIRLPDMYGRRLARRVTEERGRGAPALGVVYVTGNAIELTNDGGLGPEERFLAKPFEFDELLALVAEVAGQRGVEGAA